MKGGGAVRAGAAPLPTRRRPLTGWHQKIGQLQVERDFWRDSPPLSGC